MQVREVEVSGFKGLGLKGLGFKSLGSQVQAVEFKDIPGFCRVSLPSASYAKQGAARETLMYNVA